MQAQAEGAGEPKTAVVTGGSRGIGAAISRVLAADGWFVCLTYRSQAERAEQAVSFLCSEQASYITGTVLPVAGGR